MIRESEQCMLAVFLSFISQTCHMYEFTLNFVLSDCSLELCDKYLFKESYPS